MINCENLDCGKGHRKSLTWSWKVMEFLFQGFVRTLIKMQKNIYVKSKISRLFCCTDQSEIYLKYIYHNYVLTMEYAGTLKSVS